VCRWIEAKQDQGHPYELVFVENVTEVLLWKDYSAWLKTMINLGYDHKTIFFNSMFAPAFPCPVPQSRDRWYTVFWRQGNPAPNLDFTPPAFCRWCENDVFAMQSWKLNCSKSRAHYGVQYVYECPRCQRQVHPFCYPAKSIIDWSLPFPKIKERQKTLAENTLKNLECGLRRFGTTPFILSYYGNATYKTLDQPLGTCTGNDRHAIVIPEDDTIENCSYRMLDTEEVKRAMGFPESYKLIGTQKQCVKQCGLAVTPAVATMLVQRGLKSLGYSIEEKAVA
jgi:DNA (cytosine-5)-methyltransferase 1